MRPEPPIPPSDPSFGRPTPVWEAPTSYQETAEAYVLMLSNVLLLSVYAFGENPKIGGAWDL